MKILAPRHRGPLRAAVCAIFAGTLLVAPAAAAQLGLPTDLPTAVPSPSPSLALPGLDKTDGLLGGVPSVVPGSGGEVTVDPVVGEPGGSGGSGGPTVNGGGAPEQDGAGSSRPDSTTPNSGAAGTGGASAPAPGAAPGANDSQAPATAPDSGRRARLARDSSLSGSLSTLTSNAASLARPLAVPLAFALVAALTFLVATRKPGPIKNGVEGTWGNERRSWRI